MYQILEDMMREVYGTLSNLLRQILASASEYFLVLLSE